MLKEQGANVELNEVQCVPDKNFTTCSYPNPEKAEVYELSLKLAKESQPDLIIASDPDADRVGTMVKHNGEYIQLSGNEIGVVIEDYLFSNKNIENGIIVKSVVSTGLADKIAEKYHGVCKNVLTGFKYIGEFITNLQKENKEDKFILGFETFTHDAASSKSPAMMALPCSKVGIIPFWSSLNASDCAITAQSSIDVIR